MVLPTSGPLGLSHLRNELGGPASLGKIAFSDYVRNGAYGAVVQASPCNIPANTGGQVALRTFYGAAKWVLPAPTYPVVATGANPVWTITNQDANAKLLWIDPLQSNIAPIINYPITFYRLYQNTSGSNMEGNLFVFHDDNLTLDVNTSNLGTFTYNNSTRQFNVPLQVGQNLLKYVVTNVGGGAALVSTYTKSDGGTLFYTDTSSWVADAQCDVHYNNWHTLMTALRSSGTYGPTKAGNDPDVQYQLGFSSGGTLNNLYLSRRIQDYSSFVLHFQTFFTSSSAADGAVCFMGSTTGVVSEAGGNQSFSLCFQIYTGAGATRGLYLRNGTGTVVASYATPDFLADAWQSVYVYYTRGTTNTWTILWNGITVITYSDPQHASYLTNSGPYWGFGFRDGGAVGSFWVRHVQLYHR